MKNNEIDIIIGQKMKELRLKKGYSMQYVADRLGLKNRSSIAHIEAGRNVLSISELKELCDIYNTDFRLVLKEISEIL